MLYVLSNHAQQRILQRGIREEWIKETLEFPQKTGVDRSDASVHVAWKVISESEGRVLKVCYNPNLDPILVVTAYFDRSMRGKL